MAARVRVPLSESSESTSVATSPDPGRPAPEPGSAVGDTVTEYVDLRGVPAEIDAIVAWTLNRVGPEAMAIIESFLGNFFFDTIFRLCAWPEWHHFLELECRERDAQASGEEPRMVQGGLSSSWV